MSRSVRVLLPALSMARLLALALGTLAVLLAGCASMAPTQVTENGIAVYVRPAAEVATYCYGRIRPEDRAQPHIYGC